MTKSKLGFAFAAFYLAVVAASMLYAVYMFKFDPGNSELVGVPIIVLTLPWSMMILTAFDSVIPGNSMILAFVILLFSAFLNAALLYLVGALLSRSSGSRMQ